MPADARTDETLKARTRLEAELAELRAASAATAEDRRPVELDQAAVGRLSRMDALQVQAMAQAADRQRQQRIRRVEAALERMADGDYGWCVRCGEPIASGRLEADPAVPTCVACAT
ncbi:MAG: TraR/DksA family transcriptional regulator [Geminicoccaceae bacterium]